MIIESPGMQPSPEVHEEENFYIVINKKTKETEIKSVLLPEFRLKSKTETKKAKDGQAIVRPDRSKLHSFTDRARNELGLNPEEYTLAGPYQSEESAKKELKEFGQNAIPKLIKREERGYAIEETEEPEETQKLERMAQ